MPKPTYESVTTPGRPRLLLFEPDISARLQSVAWLRERYEVIVPADGAEPVRAARAERPEMLLISILPGRPKAAQRACRVLKSEPNPPTVAILNRAHTRLDVDELMGRLKADGYLEGQPDEEQLLRWLERSYRGERPRESLAPRGLLGRIRRRLGRG